MTSFYNPPASPCARCGDKPTMRANPPDGWLRCFCKAAHCRDWEAIHAERAAEEKAAKDAVTP